MPKFAQVALDLPLNQTFTYLIPDNLDQCTQQGSLVKVPFGPRKMDGCIVSISNNTEYDIKKVKKIYEIISPHHQIPFIILELCKWLAEYYLCSLGEAIFAGVPSVLRKKTLNKIKLIHLDQDNVNITSSQQKYILDSLKEYKIPMPINFLIENIKASPSALSTLIKKQVLRLEEVDPLEISIPENESLGTKQGLPPKPIQLNGEQKFALKRLTECFEPFKYQPFLLLGITGSGKTEVYLQAIEKCISLGKQAIVLVPEIALTPQTLAKFKNKFQNIAIMHSSLTDNQRLLEWRNMESGKTDIVIGARSAIFAPLKNVGIIIVDEEHEASYKQDSTPRYHARDIALVRAKMQKAVVVLGSATPSLETYQNAIDKKYEIIHLRNRAGPGKLPFFQTIDLKDEYSQNRSFELISSYLLSQIKENLHKKMQTIIFINRKGFYPHLSCQQCGEKFKCKSCDIGLTLYKGSQKASCNYCGYSISIPKSCPICASKEIKFKGYGTERVTELLQKIFPEAKILRMDAKTMTSGKKHEIAYLAFKNHEYDILVGTQMISKGLDFPKVTLVGILQIDASLSFIDFRMAERSFQLICQVAGRAGRAENEGNVILQSFNPEHYVIEKASHYDYQQFAEMELKNRKMLNYPPFSKLTKLLFRSKNNNALQQFTSDITPMIKEKASKYKLQCLGPAPSAIEKLENEFRIQFIVKSNSHKNRMLFASELRQDLQTPKHVQWYIDIDPQSTV